MSLTENFSAEKKDPQPMTATVSMITRLNIIGAADGTGEIYLLRIKPPAGFQYEAGQYVDIGFGALAPRSYSIANAPGQDAIEIHVKRTPGIASQYIASVLKTGDTVQLSGPFGNNVLTHDKREKLLLIAGGMGFTPFKAMIEAALRRNADAEIHFFWGTNKPGEKYMRAYFEDMAQQYDGFHFHDINGVPVGRAAADAFSDLSDYRIYVAGPPPMIAATLPLLAARGARDEALVYDRAASLSAPHDAGDGAHGKNKRSGPR